MVSKVTFARLPRVAVQLLAGVWHSSILTIICTFLGLGAETASASGAGMRSSNTERQHPVTFLQNSMRLANSVPPVVSSYRDFQKYWKFHNFMSASICVIFSCSSYHLLQFFQGVKVFIVEAFYLLG